MRNALIVAKPASFVEAVTLLKHLQGRKNLERASEFSLGPQNMNRPINNRQGNFQSPAPGQTLIGLPDRPKGVVKPIGTLPKNVETVRLKIRSGTVRDIHLVETIGVDEVQGLIMAT